jgi:hypothetical protein
MVSGKKDLWYIKVLANGILYPYDNAPSGVCTLMEEEEERRIL